MNNHSITIYHLYPDLLNLYGDKGNIETLRKRCEWRGINAEIRILTDGQEIDLDGADIVILGGGSDREQRIISSYVSMLAEPLKGYIESGGVMLALCDGYYMLGRSFESNGQTVPGLGILDFHTTSAQKRFVENIAIEAELDGKKVIIAGFENHLGEVHIGSYTPFGKVIYGFGNDATAKQEGIIYKNTIASHMHGPILPKNPELADYLIKSALQNKYGGQFLGLDLLDDSMELIAKNFVVNRELKRIAKQ